MTMALFCLGFMGMFYILLDREDRYPRPGTQFFHIWWLLMIAFSAVVGLAALFGVPPYQSKRRK